MAQVFSDFDFGDFWNKSSDKGLKFKSNKKLSNAKIAEIESHFNCKLPRLYIDLMKIQDGGTPFADFCRPKEKSLWFPEDFWLQAFVALGECCYYSSLIDFNNFVVQEWSYPSKYVYFVNMDNYGNALLAFDYKGDKSRANPRIVHIFGENYNQETLVADNFKDFIARLQKPDEDGLYSL
ncbi:SMI1/KNR4 family protein [Moraxella equi]|uniref:SMI1 / KNR4 family n=1 Tax=Moraxella equi TaxID=60442 RepID=A0A378QPI2_9GAMM|nr:SMI1/KNR4 family protein [Moraxella equi]OPH33799.1 hypothetical protein B5J93_12515 [Moraxella equi]STZ02799.1 SMI1 / KNR4 family [Moraxella equi]